jgi:hydrogenase nickel incorporation protein HypB
MKAPVIEKRFHDPNPLAAMNRQALREAGVFTVSIAGGPGCGKTSLIDATIQRLMPEVHVGVIACDISSHLDADRMFRDSDQVVQVNTGGQGVADATHIRDALQWLDLSWLDLLFIENVGTLVGPVALDLGQDVTAAVFSVAAGHDKPEKHPELVQAASVVVLNKTDLLPAAPLFDVRVFRSGVRLLNPGVELLELSALTSQGIEQWLHWLRLRGKFSSGSSTWFG